jgi:CshA-type fibril repeat protein
MQIILQKSYTLFKLCGAILGLGFLISSAQPSLAQTSFECNADAYIVVDGKDLYTHNPSTRTNTLIKANLIPESNVNAIGYNQVDNYLWGHESNTDMIVRIDNNGTTTSSRVFGLPAANYQLGDVSPTGVLFLYSSSNPTTAYQIDLTAGPPYLATSLTLSENLITTARDWAFSPRDGQLYTIIKDGSLKLVRINPTSGVVTDLGSPTIPGDAYGQLYFDNGGNLFFNGESNTYRITRPDLGNFKPNVFVTGNTRSEYSTGSDMARCTTAPLATSQPPFRCGDSKSYLFQQAPTVALEYDLTTGITTPVNDGNPLVAGATINAIGFNPVDNYIWGSITLGSTYTNHIARVGSNYSVQIFEIKDLAPGGYNTGDISLDGILYLRNGTGSYYKVDLNPSSANYLHAVAITTTMQGVSDWAVNPIDNNIYAVTASKQLLRLDPATGNVTSLGIVAGLESESTIGFGAVFMDNTGGFYLSNNSTGNIFKIADSSEGNTIAQLFASGPASTLNDGARCANSIIGPVATDDVASVSCSTSQIPVFRNDITGSGAFDFGAMRLINPTNNDRVSTITIENEGTYGINTHTGAITFTPINGFQSVSTIDYVAVDINGLEVTANLTITVNCPLPVTLVHFTAKQERETAHLSWATTEEIHSDRFEIQRSQNGKKWITIGSVVSQGEGSVLRNYSFTDPSPVNGENLYRLRMIDRDNSFTHSRIQALTFESEVMSYPNPVSDRLLVSNHKEVNEVTLYNAAGMKVLHHYTITGNGIDVKNLHTGLYTISLRFNDGRVVSQKIIIAK